MPNTNQSQSHRHARLVLGTTTSSLTGSDLARSTSITGRHIKRRVAEEEVSRPQQQSHGLGGHDGEILGGREVGQSESVPEDNVLVVDLFSWVRLDPLR